MRVVWLLGYGPVLVRELPDGRLALGTFAVTPAWGAIR